METVALPVKALNALYVEDDPDLFTLNRKLIVTDRLTPWLEPYHLPEDHSKGDRFL